MNQLESHWMSTSSKTLIATVSLISLLVVSCHPVEEENESKRAGVLRVAVASNFLPTLRELVSIYQRERGDRVKLIAASTGKLYAQIIHGAPFDILLSADSERPQLLIENGHAIASSRFTYAFGKIALWSTQKRIKNCRAMLERGQFRRLAIANPRIAPYGVAARQLLEHLALWELLQPKLIRGENIAQTLHYVESGNAQLGIIALSLIKLRQQRTGCIWEIPAGLYQPIEQQAVLLKGNANGAAAARFLAFLKSDRATTLIRDSGYGVN